MNILNPEKFQHPKITAKGEPRAEVALTRLETVWFNTGSLCNIECTNCYMESGPKKDDLSYIRLDHVEGFIDEIKLSETPAKINVHEIGFTGGEPFMNPDITQMLELVLRSGFSAIVLSNAMKPIWQKREELKNINAKFGRKLKIRVSIDHYLSARHELERGSGSWDPMIRGLGWLIENDFNVDVAGRTMWDENESTTRAEYQKLFDRLGLELDASDAARLVLFPEMDETMDVPEITTACWGILNVRPDAQMCANSRMVVLRKGDNSPQVVPCTLLPYDSKFDMGPSLKSALGPVALNHPHCAKFCVLGGASCSS
ncbi:MAG: radical SAM protein [Rhodospirillaceae bacterium]|nr:radical SAM protein [Rhodospirillaceae bacterium]